ncbi:hypothetical protein FXO38_29953 [Capsicum annuum]|nr:hypothetical protein FXO38_29953 [Capsicum annuum]
MAREKNVEAGTSKSTNENKQAQGEKAEELWKQMTTKLAAKRVDRVQLREDLRLVMANTQMPTLCMGDFNAMLNETDRLNGSPVQEGEIKDFVDFLVGAHMTELKTVGRDYTWTNGHTYSRIDHAVVNAEWIVHMSMLEVVILPPGISDHSPLSLELGGEIRSSSNTFRFFNCLAEHPEFLSKVTEAWKVEHRSGLKQNHEWGKPVPIFALFSGEALPRSVQHSRFWLIFVTGSKNWGNSGCRTVKDSDGVV